MNILEGLNNKQKEAVEYLYGPLLILAGAGSGKTHTIMSRIAHIIETGEAYPSQILAITFTNKAAAEMRDRIENFGIEDTRPMWIMTFHAACARMLRMYGGRLGYTSNFKIFDADDQTTLIRKIMKEKEYDPKLLPPAKVRSKISGSKNNGTSPEMLREHAISSEEKYIADIYADYEKELRRFDAMDFDDLLLNVLKLFDSEPDVLDYFQNKFKFVLVDEFQDTNRIQYEIVKRIAQGYNNLCVCGDDDQSIYGWRGAEISNILNFEQDWDGTKVIKLEENYRSTPEILECANAVIHNNKERKDKSLWTQAENSGDRIEVRECSDQTQEAEQVAAKIQDLYENGPYDFKDFAILYRTNAQSRNFEEVFSRANLPYKTVGSIAFYARAEIKDMLSYLSLIDNPKDDLSFYRIINQPKRTIGAKSIEKLEEFAQFKGWSLYETVENIDEVITMTPAVKKKFKDFRDLIEGLKEDKQTLAIDDLIREIYIRTGYENMLKTKKIENADARRENIEELVSAATNFKMTSEDKSISAFLENAALFSSTDEQVSDNQISLMTLHSAKGLEFPVVFMVGMEDSLFPSYMSIMNNELEEERRLCYVGITRAQKRLFLSYANLRLLYGDIREQTPSRFLSELPTKNTTFQLFERIQDRRDTEEPELKGSKRREPVNPFKKKTYQKRKNQGIDKKHTIHMGKESGNSSASYTEGDKVHHKSFGVGTVIQIKKNVVTVAFPGIGIKNLDPGFIEKA